MYECVLLIASVGRCVPKLYRSATSKESHWIALVVGLAEVGFTYEILMTGDIS